MSLGDSGVEGIQQFCDQHQCNSVCKALDLPDLPPARVANPCLAILQTTVRHYLIYLLILNRRLFVFLSDGSESEGGSIIPPPDSHPELAQNQS